MNYATVRYEGTVAVASRGSYASLEDIGLGDLQFRVAELKKGGVRLAAFAPHIQLETIIDAHEGVAQVNFFTPYEYDVPALLDQVQGVCFDQPLKGLDARIARDLPRQEAGTLPLARELNECGIPWEVAWGVVRLGAHLVEYHDVPAQQASMAALAQYGFTARSSIRPA